MLYLRDDIKQYFSNTTSAFEQLMELTGEKFRQLEGRLTQRVLLGNKYYFIKQHRGVGWKEIYKNWLQLRPPVISAQNEWQAIQALKKLNVSVPAIAAYGQRGINPAKRHSFILMEELAPVLSLEELCKHWPNQPPSFKLKKNLIAEVARIAAILHEHGINHRDFYICHFLLSVPNGIEHINPETLRLHLIDLHRAQIRRITPKRWRIKDLAGLYFSSKDAALSQRDLFRFMKGYAKKPLREIMREKDFWEKVRSRGEQLYRDHLRGMPCVNHY